MESEIFYFEGIAPGRSAQCKCVMIAWLCDELQIQDGDKIKIKKSFLIQLAKILTSQN